MRLKLTMLSAVLSAFFCTQVQATDLMDIYKEAFVRDPVVQQLKASRDAAFANLDEATASLLPQVDVTGSITGTRTSANNGINANNRNSQAGVSLSQLIWSHGAWLNRTIAEKNAEKSELAYKDALQKLILRVSQAYFNVLNAADVVSYNNANNKALKNQLDEAVRRLQVGLIAETDRLEAQAAYDLSKASVISAENNLMTSYEDLRTLTGRAVTIAELSELDLSKFSTPAVQKTIQQLLKQAEGNNLTLQQAVIDRDIARDNITRAKSGHEPTVSLNAQASTGYTRYDHQIPGSSQTTGNAWSESLGLGVNIPIYHGGATSAQVEAAQANYVAASQALEQTHRTLISDVNNGYNNVSAAISSVNAFDLSVKSASSALNSTTAGYEVGTRTMTDVLDATQKLYNAMQNAAAARYQYIMSRLSLKYTGGDLKVEDLQSVNSGLKNR